MPEPKITLPVQVKKDWGRNGQYRVSFGPVSGYGRTLAEAKQKLIDALQQALTNWAEEPAFARDDDGSLVVAIQGPTGVAHWVIRDDKPRSISYGDGPPRQSLQGCHHYTVLGPDAA